MIELRSVPVQLEIDELTHGAQWYNVKNYNLKGDGVTDDSGALNALINLIASRQKNAVIFFPDEGTYLLNGPYLDTSGANSIIKFPSVDIQAKYFTITLRGFSKPTFSPSAFSTVPLPSATKLKTTKTTGTGTRPSLFGGIGPAGGASPTFSFCTIGFQDLLIICPPNPQLTAVNMQHYTNVHTKNVGIIAGDSYGTLTSTQPTNNESWGFVQPYAGHGVYQRAEEILFVLGYKNGMMVGENCVGDEIEIWACDRGVTYGFSHGVSMIHRLSFGWTKTHFTWTAAHKIQISCVNIERWEPPHGGVANRWYNFTADINDPGNVGRGELVYQAARANVGEVQGLFNKPAGNQLYIREMGVAP